MLDNVTYLDDGLVLEDKRESPLWVIPKDLCTRCGACHVICPPNVVKFNDHEFPYIESEGCIDCGLCLKVCPGIDFNMNQKHEDMFQAEYQPQKMSGTFRKAYLGHAANPVVRQEGAAGGVVTQLLVALLKQGLIDGAVVVGNNPDDPSLPMPRIARTEDDILAAAQSKYTTVANTKVLRELKGTKERFAFVGVACQVHGLRNLESYNKRLHERNFLTIGLACRGTLEKDAIRDLVEVNGVQMDDLWKISHRGGAFPGKFQAHFKTGETRDLHHFEYKDGAYNMMLRMYLPDRCHMCPDYSAEFSDITCSDMWLRGKDGKYLHPKGSTLILCRTEKGQQVIEALMQSGTLVLEPVEPRTVDKAYAHLRRERKMISFLRIAQRQQQGKHAPNFGLDAAEQVSKMSWSDRLYEFTYRLTFLFAKRPRARRTVLYFLFSPVGMSLIFLKIKSKQWRGAVKARMKAKQGA